MNDTRENIASLIKEAKNYYTLQKDYLRYTAAEQLTNVISTLAIVVIASVLALIILVFAGLAIVHWVGAAIGNIALCYALFALFMALLLLVIYLNRRRWIVLPLARIMTKAFIKPENEENNPQ